MQRKVFRIEQTLAKGLKSMARAASNAPPNGGAAMRDPSVPAGKAPRMTRAAGELGAAVEGMEKAVQTILHSAEIINDCARALAYAPKNGHERKLAKNMQEHLTRIYEACNFQDLAGQRIGKVIETLSTVEDCVARAAGDGMNEMATAQPKQSRRHINGPRLDGEIDSVDQRDVDAMFG